MNTKTEVPAPFTIYDQKSNGIYFTPEQKAKQNVTNFIGQKTETSIKAGCTA